MLLKLNYLALVFILSAGLFACNSETNDKDDESGDKKENTQVDVGYEKPRSVSYDGRKNDIAEFNKERFYPIGWSEKGHFAFVKAFTEQGSGFFRFEIFILNMFENKKLWSWKCPEETEAQDTAFSMIWNNNRSLINKNLKKYEIIPVKSPKIQPLVFTMKGNNFKISLDKETKINPDFNIKVLSSAKIKLESPELGSKEFTHEIAKDDFWVEDIKVSGYLKSPYSEDVIGIIYSVERMGFEGPPSDVLFHLIGCGLTKGFEK